MLEGNGSAQLMNSNGSVVSELTLNQGINQLSTTHLPTGVYYLRVKAIAENETAIYKVMKQ